MREYSKKFNRPISAFSRRIIYYHLFTAFTAESSEPIIIPEGFIKDYISLFLVYKLNRPVLIGKEQPYSISPDIALPHFISAIRTFHRNLSSSAFPTAIKSLSAVFSAQAFLSALHLLKIDEQYRYICRRYAGDTAGLTDIFRAYPA